jgi:6-phosphogluconate dehydrogenase
MIRKDEFMTKANIGVIGLGVMGEMLVLNMERNGFRVAVYNRSPEKVVRLMEQNPEKDLVGTKDLETFARAMEQPRKILLMVPAGNPVDGVIEDLKPFLDEGDLLIDGGNTHFTDTERRALELRNIGIIYLGTGISGGEYGALWGPSIMPGGPKEAWNLIQPIFETIAAKVDEDPCVTYIGPGGSGHYVKMVHNGIEYADMQLIAEVYHFLHQAVGLSNQQLHDVFTSWNDGDLASYLIRITGEIFARVDEETDQPLIDFILDEAKQKGTGKWTSQNALDLGSATPTINAAVEARILSGLKNERAKASKVLRGPQHGNNLDQEGTVLIAQDALYAAKIISYAQGFSLLRDASHEYGYNLDLSAIARIWRGGCIIQAALLENIRTAFHRNPDLSNLLLDPDLGKAVEKRQNALRQVLQMGIENGIPLPALSSALAYFDGYRTARLPANLTQAQRDYFGSHTYRRLDREGTFHTEWIDLSKGPEKEG